MSFKRRKIVLNNAAGSACGFLYFLYFFLNNKRMHSKFLLIILIVVIGIIIIGCTENPVCGDGECNDNENCTTCPGDCGECPTPPEQNEEFLSKTEIKNIVESKFSGILTQEESPISEMYKQDNHAKIGDPVLVRTINEEPSYWRVPEILEGKVIGFMDVKPDGKVTRFGHFGCFSQSSKTRNISNCPSVVTLNTAEEAKEIAKNITDKYGDDAIISEPIFVHDGAETQLAWMLKIEKNNEIISRVFVSKDYTYEKKAGEEEPSICGFDIAFEENLTEDEVKSILSDLDLPLPYELQFNVDDILPYFYTIIPEDNFESVKNNLKEKENIILAQKLSKKINNRIIIAIDNEEPENEISPIMETYGLEVKRFTWVVVYYDYENSGISENMGNILKESLEKNENVIYVGLCRSSG